MTSGVVALALGLAGCINVPGRGAVDRVVSDHNSARNANGIAGMAVDGGAEANAQRAADQLRDGSGGRSCMLRHTSMIEMSAYYPGRQWGENIGCYPGCADAADDATPAFLGSSTHRANVLDRSFRGIGVGLSCNERYLFVVVQYVS